MRTVHGIKSQSAPQIVTILALDLTVDDRFSLREILSRTESGLSLTCRWRLEQSSGIESVLRSARWSPGIAVVICDHDLGQGRWKRLLLDVRDLSRPPLVIVASRLADDRLWAEALNLGAYDVLSKPFESTEALRVIGHAMLRWQREQATLPADGTVRSAVA